MEKMYDELAAWWPLLSPVEGYAAEAPLFRELLRETAGPHASLLELGCGGGHNAYYLKQDFARVTLTDLSAQMLAMSRALNSDCEHLQGDMRTLRLGRAFDAVFVHDAIEYMTTLNDLRLAMETAYVHCKPGGLALFVPDVLHDTFKPATDHGGGDGDTRALRYLEWTYDPDPHDSTYAVDYVYVLHDGDRPARVEHEQHIHGLHERADWLRLLNGLGFAVRIVPDRFEREIFVARKPATTEATPSESRQKVRCMYSA